MPCLLLAGDRLVKTTRFADPVYVGDPVNVLSIFNDFEVDEIVLLDVEASIAGRGPQFDLIAHLATECFIPLAYGGGIATADDARRVFEAGLEKVVLNTAPATHPEIITEIASSYGSQAVMGAVDARLVDGRYIAHVRSASEPLGRDPAEEAKRLEELGAGEILVTAVDRDGTMDGYDLDLVAMVAGAVSVPVIACGGAAKRATLADPIAAGASAVAAGSLFVFQGRRRGVLINFPSRADLQRIFSQQGP